MAIENLAGRTAFVAHAVRGLDIPLWRKGVVWHDGSHSVTVIFDGAREPRAFPKPFDPEVLWVAPEHGAARGDTA